MSIKCMKLTVRGGPSIEVATVSAASPVPAAPRSLCTGRWADTEVKAAGRTAARVRRP